MTSMMEGVEVLKQDAWGRVRVPVERREALLEEFEKSGASAASFAKLAGIKYPTFANWAQKRRKERAARVAGANNGGAIRLFEAEVAGARAKPAGLAVELPGGSRIVVESPVQIAMAAELVALIAERSGC